ncbi:39S ribosomal protein L1 [Trichonephila inaurata madagascariensis]|uniref:39S ribosomal protein L1 n=1 Tax=Trichonephila inaurata madagascariensis TaxID=2747483 RepID=A0A8X6YVN2_9ARAC|nr:39S ribosomal protein L1 [Trichonephila inaurata madagascariensis]
MFTKTLFPAFMNYSFRASQLNILGLNCNKIYVAPNLEIVRYAARKGTRVAALAKKKARKAQKKNEPQSIPKYLQRKIKVSAELERKRCTDENWLETKPIDNVYNMKLYRGKPYTVAEAVKMHRESHCPEMLNDPSALIYANVELELKLKKKDRYIEELNGIVTFPHEFKVLKKNKIIVLCKEVDEQVKATEAGAAYSGSSALIKQILAGTVSKEDFDFVICHPDMLKEANTLRGILGKKFPNTNNGLLRLDVVEAVKSFINGIEYKLKHSSLEIDFGWIDVPFGRLDMTEEHLEENLKFLLNIVEKQKPTGTDHLLFILRTLLWCEKSKEKFKIAHWKYLPNYPENGVLKEEEDEDVKSNAQ